MRSSKETSVHLVHQESNQRERQSGLRASARTGYRATPCLPKDVPPGPIDEEAVQGGLHTAELFADLLTQ